MRTHSFQHVPFEDIGSMAADLTRMGCSHSVTHWYKGEKPPSLDQIDFLIVMGGPMGANDESIYPWIADEKKIIAEAIKQGKKILGICLGAQLIAAVLGAEVKRNPHREIGWFPLIFSEQTQAHPIAKILSKNQTVFHWHGDTFDLPLNALHIASSEACKQQAFVINNQIFGFQFHLETTELSAKALLEHCGDELEHCGNELDHSRYVQNAQQILNNASGFLAINQAMSEVLNFILNCNSKI